MRAKGALCRCVTYAVPARVARYDMLTANFRSAADLACAPLWRQLTTRSNNAPNLPILAEIEMLSVLMTAQNVT